LFRIVPFELQTGYTTCKICGLIDAARSATAGPASAPALAKSKSWFIGRFTLPTKSAKSGLGNAIPKHVDWKIAVALLAAPIVPGLESLLYFVGFLYSRFNKVMRLPAIGHAVQSLAQQTVD